MLSNDDIMLVAAHDHADQAKKHYEEAGSPPQVTPEMLQYTIFTKLFTEKRAIRLREGNTLFALYVGSQGAMFFVFDADTTNNTVRNLVTACEAARKMGFERLVAPTTDAHMKRLAKRAFDKHHRKGDSISTSGNTITIELSHV